MVLDHQWWFITFVISYLVYRPIHSYSNRDLYWNVWAQFLRKDFQHWKHLKRDWVKLQSFEKRKKMIKTNLLTRVGNFHLNHLKIFSQSRTLGTIPLPFPSGISDQEFWGVFCFMLLHFHHTCLLSNNWRLALSLLAEKHILDHGQQNQKNAPFGFSDF